MHAGNGQRLGQFLETARQFDAQRVSAARAIFQRHFEHVARVADSVVARLVDRSAYCRMLFPVTRSTR